MKRFIDKDLKKWKERTRRKPLILRGARQVGKTYSVMRFGEDSFDNVAVVNLERNPEWIGCWVLGIGDWVLGIRCWVLDSYKLNLVQKTQKIFAIPGKPR